MQDTIEAPFTPDLLQWLIAAGYTHVFERGVLTDLQPVEQHEDDPFILYPLKPGDEEFKLPECRDRIEPITNDDVAIMSEGDPLIRFVVVLPLPTFESYLKSSL